MAASRRVPRGMHVAAGVAASAAAVVWIIRRRRRADALADDHEPPPPPPKLGQATSMSRASPSTRDDLREAFVSLANDDGVLEVHEFQAVIRQLRFDLSETEVRRVFARIDTNGVGRITCDQFLKGVQRIPFLRSVVSNYSPRHQTAFRVPADYDYATYTNANYGAPADAGFHGEFAEIRAGRDYGYHVNYARARQLWQDAAISMVVTRTHPQPRPWIVFTCGPMGAGKGYVMSWMSSSGLFPLEQIVHIDPDHFKRIMPEWDAYVARDAERAGTLCHRESGFLQEIAQEVALRRRQHVWVDGSLRDGPWFSLVFDDIRERFPEYSIAIFYVYASEKTVRARIAARAEQTGRAIPEKLINDSLDQPDRSLKVLTPKTDFVARISNDADGDPVLEAFEVVDHSGCWGAVRDRFAQTASLPSEFPQNLASRCVRPTRFADAGDSSLLSLVACAPPRLQFSPGAMALTPELEALHAASLLSAKLVVPVSESTLVNLDPEARAAAAIPQSAVSFAFAFGALGMAKVAAVFERAGLDSRNAFKCPEVAFLVNGGWVYFDVRGRLVCANAVLMDDVDSWGASDAAQGGVGVVTFAERRDLPRAATTALTKATAWHDVIESTALYSGGARKFTWLGPQQVVGNCPVGDRYGSFAFLMESGDGIFFPVI